VVKTVFVGGNGGVLDVVDKQHAATGDVLVVDVAESEAYLEVLRATALVEQVKLYLFPFAVSCAGDFFRNIQLFRRYAGGLVGLDEHLCRAVELGGVDPHGNFHVATAGHGKHVAEQSHACSFVGGNHIYIRVVGTGTCGVGCKGDVELCNVLLDRIPNAVLGFGVDDTVNRGTVGAEFVDTVVFRVGRGDDFFKVGCLVRAGALTGVSVPPFVGKTRVGGIVLFDCPSLKSTVLDGVRRRNVVAVGNFHVLLNMMPAVIDAATNATTRMIAMMIVRVLVLGLA